MKQINQPHSGTEHDSSAGVPPAVAGVSRPRFGEVTIRHRGRLSHWEKENATYFITFRLEGELERAVRYVVDNPARANLLHWKWVWVCGRGARTTAAGDGGATRDHGTTKSA